jgi:putative acetyltransferase
MVAPMRIRRARIADGAGILAAHEAAIRAGCCEHYAADEIEAWVRRLAPGTYAAEAAVGDVLVAEIQERVVGFGALDGARGQLRALYAHPDATPGTGRRLLDALETIARLRGLGRLTLDSSLNAVPFYVAAGWHVTGDGLRTFPGGPAIHCTAMTKALPALRVAIRDERAGDAAAIRSVERDAFERDGEARLVDGLRDADALAVSLVATLDHAVVGHVAFSPVMIAGATASVVGLGPVAVSPPWQRCAVGARLCEEGLARARERGHGAAVVLGHPGYYPRFGFVPASRFGLSYPGDVPDGAFLAAELVPGALRGAHGPVRYRSEFDAV